MPSYTSSSKKRPGRKNDARGRAFRILVWVFALFGLAQIGGGLVLDHVWVRPRYPMKAKMLARLKARHPAPEILIFGSSRMGGDANEAILDAMLRRQLGEGAPRTFNASLPFGDPTVYERVFEEISQAGQTPKLIVLEVDPVFLAQRDNWLQYHALNVLEWRDVPEALTPLCRNGRPLYLVKGRLLPLYLHRYHICKESIALVGQLFRSQAGELTADPPVSQPIDTDPEPPVQTPAMLASMEAGYVDVVRQLKNYRIGGVVCGRLEHLLERCHSAGVKVVLVSIPVHSSSRRGCTPAVNAMFLEYMHGLSARYGCTFADWRDSIPDAYFVDTHHTNHQGGVYFSRRFAASLLAPAWQEAEARHISEQDAGRQDASAPHVEPAH